MHEAIEKLNKKCHYPILCLKGFLIGAATLIPGLSGGTAAIALGEYESILTSFVKFFSNMKKNSIYLGIVLAGALAGVALSSYPLLLFSSSFPVFSKAVFCFAALLSLFLFLEKSIGPDRKPKECLFTLAGFGAAALFTLLTKTIAFDANNLILLFPVGIMLALALVLPAISFSYMMLFFGIYEPALEAVNNVDIAFLAMLSAGIFTGCVLFSRIFLSLIKKHPNQTYYTIAGFVVFSVFGIFL